MISAVDLIIIIAYLAGMIFLGMYFSRKNVNTEEYFLGGRSFGGIVIGISLIGTSISSMTFLAFPADAYKTSWIRFLSAFMLPLAIFIAAKFFIPFFRKRQITSAYEYLEVRFGASIRVYAAFVFLFSQLVRIAIVLYLLSVVICEITGFHPVICVLIAGSIVAVYTVIGGINAVIWTDVIQTIILVLGGILAIVVIIHKIPGGLGQIISIAVENNKLSFSEMANGVLENIPLGLSLSRKTVSMMFILGLTGWLSIYCSDQNVIQRYCASKSTKEAKKALWVSLLSVPIWAFYMFLGTSLFVFFKLFPTAESIEMYQGIRKAEQIFPFFILHYLPVGFVGIVLAAVLAAAMSSLDSNINSFATVFVVDIYKRHFVKGKGDYHYLRLAWVASICASIFMVVGAICLIYVETETIQDTANILVSLLSGGILSIYLLGFFTKYGDSRAIWSGILCTFIFTLWTIFTGKGLLPEAMTAPFDLYYTGLIGNIIMFIVAFTVAQILSPKRNFLESSG